MNSKMLEQRWTTGRLWVSESSEREGLVGEGNREDNLENPYLAKLKAEMAQAEGPSRKEVGGLEWAKRTGEMLNMTWRESQAYLEWVGADAKDERLTFRISGRDMMKIKAFAMMKGKRYMTYVREIVIREIRREEEALAQGG